MIEKHEILYNQDELGLQTSCIMLVDSASLWIYKKCWK